MLKFWYIPIDWELQSLTLEMTLIDLGNTWTPWVLGNLSPILVDPIHLCDELLRIQKELPPTIELPEYPANNIWHYYKYLTISFVPHTDKIILMIRIPLVDSNSSMTLYKVYNLPIFNHHIEKSLKYNLEGNYLAITNDNNYATIPSQYEFIECTLASGHFCNLKNALYHMHSSGWCLTSLFSKMTEWLRQIVECLWQM